MLESIYLQITDVIGKIIPADWSKVVLYSEILDKRAFKRLKNRKGF
ncbi:immunity protein YezG family protein [Bacillus subtilis]|nr:MULTISPECIES: immunity protein YezG family protein [Bacillus]MCL0027221.1 antitoxin YezG family protein [Bacillus sp. C21]MCL8471776.1 antitoxin YezG family protein [Bacillus subtilis]MCM3011068.1 antitoxin YezG family protein [Bacillus subtilis]MDK8209600.1 DUF600 family protein [Bacillus subtilis]MED4559772.1 DUF600 family protein [Bacillus subtilis]